MTRSWRRALGPLGAAALSGVLLAGCGLPTDASPRAIKPETVPYNLLGVNDTDAPTAPADADLRPITVYLVRDDDGKLVLKPSSRQIATPVNLDTVVGNLMAGGTTTTEKDLELANLVPGKELVGINPRNAAGATTTVQVTPDFFDRLPRGESRRLAIAQIVFTVTEFGSAEGKASQYVRFTVNGEARKVPTADGQAQPVVSRADYATFDPTVTTSTTAPRTPDTLPPTTTGA